jgi:hypothetical protein
VHFTEVAVACWRSKRGSLYLSRALWLAVNIARQVKMLETPMRQRGIALPAEIDTSTLAEQIRKEAVDIRWPV